MGLMGSALGRGLAGAGAGAAAVANKYIDEELAADRARLLADLQHQGAVRLDQYQNSPERQATLRRNAADATTAQAAASRQAELDGLNDTGYQGARTGRKDADATEQTARDVERLKTMTPAEVEAANAKIGGTAQAEANRAGLIARAQERERNAGADASIVRKIKQMETVLGRPLTEDERLAAIGLAKAKGDADLVTVEEVVDDGEGNKVTRKWKEGKPKPPTEEVAHAEAQAAVAAGAPAAAVNARLKEMGFAPLPAPQAAGARPRLQSADPASADPLRSASTDALRRIAASNEPRSQAAKAELQRRERARGEAADIPVPGGA